MTKVLIATVKPFAGAAKAGIREVLEEAGYHVELLEKYASQEEFISAASTADALIIRSDIVDKSLIDRAGNLKIVVRAGAGYDNVDLGAASGKNVVVMNTPGQNSNAVAELALGMMVYMARNQFNGTSGTELYGKSLGLQAYGNVGRHVARIASGFGMKLHAFDPFIERSVIEAGGIIPVDSVEELYRNCQYVSLHIPANDETKGSVGYGLMSLMPEGAVLINAARKEVIDEAGLKQMMAKRDDFRYATDVAPGNAGELDKEFPGRIFCTPKKMGAQTAEANINAGVAAARQIVGFLEKGEAAYRVN